MRIIYTATRYEVESNGKVYDLSKMNRKEISRLSQQIAKENGLAR